MQGASDKFVSCPKRSSCWPQAIGQTLLSSPGNYSEHPSNHIAILISWICINCYVFLCSRKVPEYYFGMYLLICFRSTVFIISLCYSELMQPSQVGLLKGKKCTYISQSPVHFEVGRKHVFSNVIPHPLALQPKWLWHSSVFRKLLMKKKINP